MRRPVLPASHSLPPRPLSVAFVGGYVIEDERLSTVAATFCFIIGSAFFVAGAMVDLLVLVRAPYKKRPASTETSCLVSSASS